MSNVLRVKVYTQDSEDPFEFDTANYVSWVNGETYGKPAIIAPTDGEPKVSADEYPVTVVYINPANIVAVQVERES